MEPSEHSHIQNTNLPSYRIVFAGTPDFAAKALAGLIDSRHQLVAVYSQPDRPAGRGQKLLASPVKALALKHNIPIEQAQNLSSPQAVATLNAYQADFLVVAAYGVILPPEILKLPRFCCLNIHASLLPRWRGAAPIQRAIMAGDKKTGISIMKMEQGLDTGEVLLTKETAINADDTGESLHDRLADLGSQALLDCLDNFELLFLQRCPQEERLASYAQKLSKAEAKIDWNKDALTLSQMIQAFNSWPVAYTSLGQNTLRVWDAYPLEQAHQERAGEIISHERDAIWVACGKGMLVLTQLQLPGKKVMSSKALLNARKDFFSVGKRFD